jgi:integrase
VDGKVRTTQPDKRLAPVDTLHKTKASVRGLADEILAPINAHTRRPETVTTVRDFVETVYLPHVKQHKRPSTHAGYRDAWQRHLKPRCGDAWLREVRTPAVQGWLEEIGGEDDVSRTTLKHIKHLLSGIFRYAIQQDYFDAGKANPVTAASIPADARSGGDTYAYSLEEIQQMLAVLPQVAATVVGVAAFAGLRRGEIRGLEWPNYELPARVGGMPSLRVTKSVWHGIGTEPKTEKSKAPVPVIAPLAKMLDSHRVNCGNPSSGPMFTNLAGKPLDLNDLYRRVMADVLRSTHIQWHGWHAFRRGLATNLHRLGVADKVIQRVLRHANVAVTQASYIKTVDADAAAAMKRLERLMTTSHQPQYRN